MTQPQYSNFAPVPTDWNAFDVPALWAMVESEQEWANREQVGAWMRMHDLLVSHQENLQRIKQGVAVRWPPEGSAAARRFLARLDQMIDSAQQGSYAARSNASALDLLTDALLEAKSELQPLNAAWQSATPQEQAKLDEQARAVMSKADERVVEHGNQFAMPPAVHSPLDRATVDPSIAQQQPSRSYGTMAPPVDEPFGTSPRTPDRLAPVQPDKHTTTAPSSGLQPGPALTANPPFPPSPSVLQPQFVPGQVGNSPDALTVRGLPIGGAISPPFAADGLSPRSMASSTRMPATVWDPGRTEQPDRAVRPIQAAARNLSDGATGAGNDHLPPGLIGGGIGAGTIRASATRERQYPADEEWDLPPGVPPVVRSSPVPDPKTAFDPGPNVIGGRR